MTATEKLRRDVKKQIDSADEQSLRMVNAMLTVNAEHDWWDDLSEAAKASIAQGLKDADEGRVKAHSEIMKKYKKWLQ